MRCPLLVLTVPHPAPQTLGARRTGASRVLTLGSQEGGEETRALTALFLRNMRFRFRSHTWHSPRGSWLRAGLVGILRDAVQGQPSPVVMFPGAGSPVPAGQGGGARVPPPPWAVGLPGILLHHPDRTPALGCTMGLFQGLGHGFREAGDAHHTCWKIPEGHLWHTRWPRCSSFQGRKYFPASLA